MSALNHHVVGHIHEIVERPDAGRLQTPLHPGGRGCDLYPTDHPRSIAGAQVGVGDRDAGLRGDGWPALLYTRFTGSQRRVGQGRDFPGEPEHAETVSTVRGDRHV